MLTFVGKTKKSFRHLHLKLSLKGYQPLFWAQSGIRNWGDDLNPWLFNKLTGAKAKFCDYPSYPKLLMAGSILHRAGPNDICWGTGLLSPEHAKFAKLRKVVAVRGPLTHQLLLQNGIDVPQLFGDPGILAPDLVNVSQTKLTKAVLIPHYTEEEAGRKWAQEKGADFLSVSTSTEDFIARVAQSEVVVSSSLHGIICAESLGIPAVWTKFGGDIIGGRFKFDDYLLGTGRQVKHLVPLDSNKSHINLDSLIQEALPPFNVSEYKAELLRCFPFATKRNVS